jgi:hypothetical protein
MQGDEIVTLGSDLGSRGGDFVLVRLAAPTGGVISSSGSKTSLRVTPNPATSNVMLHLEPSQGGLTKIEMIDVAGRVALDISSDIQPGVTALAIDVKALRAGVYVVRVTLKEGQSVGSIVIQ